MEQLLASYENIVLAAVSEVETTLVAIANESERYRVLRLAAAASDETVRLVKGNYREGLVDFQRMLDAERTKLNTDDQAAESRGRIAANYVALFRALGGGTQFEPILEPTQLMEPIASGTPHSEDENFDVVSP